MSKPKTLPDSATDSITSLSELVRAIPYQTRDMSRSRLEFWKGPTSIWMKRPLTTRASCMTRKRSKSWAPITMSPPLKTPRPDCGAVLHRP